MFSRINDKLLHFLACLVITLTVGELCAVTPTVQTRPWCIRALTDS